MSALIGGGVRPVQRAKADGNYTIDGRATSVAGTNVGKGGVGGRSHSEQKLWTHLKEPITNALEAGRRVDLTFDVDTTICHLCSPWFENELYPYLASKVAPPGRFSLHVSVNGVVVDVVGAQTIWPPEVADAPTFDRMGEMERSMRYIEENRDETGELTSEAVGDYAQGGIDALNDALDRGQHNNLNLGTIGTRLARARVAVAGNALIAVQFDAEEAETPYATWATGVLADVAFSQIARSGRFMVPTLPRAVNAAATGDWLDELETRLKSWLTDWIDEHDDFVRVQKPY